MENNTKINFSDSAKIYEKDGTCVLSGVLPSIFLSEARSQIMHILNLLACKTVDFSKNSEEFSEQCTDLIFDLVNSDPNNRSRLYNYIQKIPALYQMAAHETLINFARKIGILHPSVIEAKVQMFLPWEKMFFQDCHQDINSLGSSRSITFWVPMQTLFPHTAVRYWVGSQNEGPVVHEVAKEDPDEGIFLERVPLSIQNKYPVIKTAAAKPGDVIAINRLTFHQSPDFYNQVYSRWSFVIRYDDLEKNGFNENAAKYESFTPYPSSKQSVILAKIKEKLKNKPNPDWKKDKKNVPQ